MSDSSRNIPHNIESIKGVDINADGPVNFRAKNISAINNYNNYNYPPEKDIKDKKLPPLAKFFQGRNDELKELKSLFFDRNQKEVIICGLPGFGKTELAVQFVTSSRNKKEVDHVLWFDATEGNLYNSFEDHAINLNIVKYNKETIASLVYNRFDTNNKVLVVFDNAPNRNSIIEYQPESDNFLCLITSINNNWMDVEQPIKINELSPEPALQILRDKVNYEENDSYMYKRLAKTCGYVPLALQIVGSYLQYETRSVRSKFDLENYIKDLENSTDVFLNNSASDYKLRGSCLSYEKSIYEAIKISMDKINEENKLALKVLFMCSHFNPENISYKILKLLTEEEDNKIVDNIKHLLDDFSLVKIFKEEEKITMHSFTQRVIRYHVIQCETQFQNEIFGTCLTLTRSNDYYIHIPSIISCVDQTEHYTTMFLDYFYKNETDLTTRTYTKLKKYEASCTGLQLFLEILIEGRCKKSLKKILDHLGSKARERIDEFNLLNEAVMSDDSEILILLLDYSPNVNKQDMDDHTALFLATFKWNEDMIEKLIAAEADENMKDDNDNTILHMFFRGAYHIEHSIDVEQVKRMILKVKGTTNLKEIRNYHGETLLHEAATSFRPELVEFLINEHGLLPNTEARAGWTPLHSLICQASKFKVDEKRVIETVKTLLTHKPDLYSYECDSGKSKMTALQMAESNKLDYLIKFFSEFIKRSKETIDNEGECKGALDVQQLKNRRRKSQIPRYVWATTKNNKNCVKKY